MKQRFFKCNICGQIMTVVNDTNLPITCCQKDMEELVPNVTDGAKEKHVPMVKIDGNKVTIHVGSEDHPMTNEHYIQWISITTSCGVQRKELKPTDKPMAEFYLAEGEKVKAVYEYCNIHGLWMSEAQ